MALFAEQAKDVDIIITTALIPGKPAPKLITADMVRSMKTGSVIVDLAAEQGGNCELTQKDRVVVEHGVTIIGYTDLPSRLAAQSSQLYATNLRHLLTDMTPAKDGNAVVDMDDEVVRGATVVQGRRDHLAAAPAEAVRRADKKRRPRRRRCLRRRSLRRSGRSPRWPSAAWRCSASAPSRRRRSWRTSRCSCSPVSSATW